MYVGWYMKTKLLTITPETSVFKAREMMDNHRISHLPVTDGKAHLVGLVTDRDLRQVWASPATTLSVHELTYVLQKLTVANVMTRNVVTATPDMHIERAALIIHDKKFGALPVVKDDRLVGIITVTDLMQVVLTALGLSDNTKRLSLLAVDRIGLLAEVCNYMAQAGINISSVLFVPLVAHPDVWQVILRVNTDVYDKAVSILTEAGYKVITQYVEDLTAYLPR
ncbi:CBS and ACT domain-containing protein [Syntrophobacter fumaroxidans]|uniref:CBS domain containing membrane protein n=1 Tax=Syntrophobacter fumaroxidans (strain DSM 10017 / MPOB) TaxID=335543 RepID=A0LJJ8_SYNFM|nr:CBS and ACT domain-containing protein [Syntrophobacter fumaroxidans]ABK17600.1 CBS domain containing membrane protein [Syntrophobacter fumaroxidans MPOB]